MQQSFDPKRFLILARKLLDDPDYERNARARTAIGRIYYTVFLLALQKLQEKGVRIEDKDKIHQSVIEAYNEKGLSIIGNGLDQLREKRVNADYHMAANVALDKCKQDANFSEYIIDLIEQVKEIN